jgi:AcrR family transcriptional regulator
MVMLMSSSVGKPQTAKINEIFHGRKTFALSNTMSDKSRCRAQKAIPLRLGGKRVEPMVEEKNDRRYVKTEERILQAMTDLLRMRKFDKITVTDICKLAHVSHSSFYAHFSSKQDLVKKYEARLLHDTTNDIASHDAVPLRDVLVRRLQFLNDKGELIALLLSKNGSPEIQRQLEEDFIENFKHIVLPRMNVTIRTEVGERYLSVFLANAMLGVIQEWIDSGRKETPERLAHLLESILGATLGGTRKAVEGGSTAGAGGTGAKTTQVAATA